MLHRTLHLDPNAPAGNRFTLALGIITHPDHLRIPLLRQVARKWFVILPIGRGQQILHLRFSTRVRLYQSILISQPGLKLPFHTPTFPWNAGGFAHVMAGTTQR